MEERSRWNWDSKWRGEGRRLAAIEGREAAKGVEDER